MRLDVNVGFDEVGEQHTTGRPEIMPLARAIHGEV
jgi:hypothetical protein